MKDLKKYIEYKNNVLLPILEWRTSVSNYYSLLWWSIFFYYFLSSRQLLIHIILRCLFPSYLIITRFLFASIIVLRVLWVFRLLLFVFPIKHMLYISFGTSCPLCASRWLIFSLALLTQSTYKTEIVHLWCCRRDMNYTDRHRIHFRGPFCMPSHRDKPANQQRLASISDP